MFTLAISCLTTSNLPWFMDLTFHVPMQCCSLQHRILLPSLVPSTAGCCLCFGSISSFFLELFLHWSSVAYWATFLFAFSCCSWGSQGRNTEVVCHFLIQWTTLLSELSNMICPSSVTLQVMAHSFIELDKAVVHVIILVSFLWLWFYFCLPSDREGEEAYGSFLMGETDWGGNWVLFRWAGPGSVNL